MCTLRTRRRNLKRPFDSGSASNVFRPHYAREIENTTNTGLLDLCLRKTQVIEIT